jgi:hypothetical protein
MNFDRYLATSYPFFHRTSITKRRLVTLLLILIILEVTLALISVNDFVISNQVYALIFFVIVFPPMLFINYKLFTIARKSRRNGLSFGMKKFSLKNVSNCLLAVACFLVLSIPLFVYIGLKRNSIRKTFALDHLNLLLLWIRTIGAMNGTFNCLIFYWRNKILRTEGMNVIKGLKLCAKLYFWTKLYVWIDHRILTFL